MIHLTALETLQRPSLVMLDLAYQSGLSMVNVPSLVVQDFGPGIENVWDPFQLVLEISLRVYHVMLELVGPPGLNLDPVRSLVELEISLEREIA